VESLFGSEPKNLKIYLKGSIKNKDKHEIASEVADIFIYILEFCQENDTEKIIKFHIR